MLSSHHHQSSLRSFYCPHRLETSQNSCAPINSMSRIWPPTTITQGQPQWGLIEHIQRSGPNQTNGSGSGFGSLGKQPFGRYDPNTLSRAPKESFANEPWGGKSKQMQRHKPTHAAHPCCCPPGKQGRYLELPALLPQPLHLPLQPLAFFHHFLHFCVIKGRRQGLSSRWCFCLGCTCRYNFIYFYIMLFRNK